MFSLRLQELRKTKGFTQVQLASALSVSSGTIAMWETAKRTPDSAMLIRLADFFDVSVDYLLGRDFETKKEAPQAAELSGMEETVLILFRGLDREDKAALLSYLHFLSYTHAQKEDAQRSDSADTSAG